LGVDDLYEFLLDIVDGGCGGLEELTFMMSACDMSALSDFWVYCYVCSGGFDWKKLVMAGMCLFCRQIDHGRSGYIPVAVLTSCSTREVVQGKCRLQEIDY
jgi:hypothetical protein